MATYVLNVFNYIFCCLKVQKLQMIFTFQMILSIFNSVNMFIMNAGFRLVFVLKISTI